MKKNRKKLITTIYLDPDQDKKLRRFAKKSHIPMAEIVRLSIDLWLVRHGLVL